MTFWDFVAYGLLIELIHELILNLSKEWKK